MYARLSPGQKQRIIRALQQRGHIVGFLGDGINDAPALHTADVGLSVDSAVDIAKDSADVILLEKNLMVITDAVREGRAVFANILKYVRMGASSNFGNMFSVIGASAWLPFVPMAPIQILTNNLLYDFSQLPIPTDRVDEQQLATPKPWSLTALRRYIMIIGPLSSIFDYTTFALLYFVLGAHDIAHAGLFQTGWFVESLMTQTLVIYVIRTNRIPFLQSRPSWPLMATTIAVLAVGLWLPVSPFAGSSRVGDAYFGYASDTRFPTAVGDSLIITLVATEDLPGRGPHARGTLPKGTWVATGTYSALYGGTRNPLSNVVRWGKPPAAFLTCWDTTWVLPDVRDDGWMGLRPADEQDELRPGRGVDGRRCRSTL